MNQLLKSIIGECHKVISLLQKEQLNKNKERDDIERIKKKIRESRIEVTSMHYEAKLEKASVVRRKDMERQIRTLQREISSISSCNYQESMQSNKLQRLCDNMKTKMTEIDKKINSIKAQQLGLADQFESIDKSFKLQKILNQKKIVINNLNKQFQEQQQSFCQAMTEKQKEVTAVDSAINSLNEKQFDLQAKIRCQFHIIREILEGEVIKLDYAEELNSNDVVILNKDEEKLFENKVHLEIWEKYEVQDVRLKKQQIEVNEQKMMGRIIRLRNNTQNMFGKIIRNRKYGSFSQQKQTTHHNSYVPSRKSLPMMQRSEDFSSKQRLVDLEKNKRIRTRFTEMKKYPEPQKFNSSRRYIQPIKDDYETESTSTNIVEKYQKLKQKAERNKNSSNIEVIKLTKLTNKKKRMMGQKGVAVERDDGR